MSRGSSATQNAAGVTGVAAIAIGVNEPWSAKLTKPRLAQRRFLTGLVSLADQV